MMRPIDELMAYYAFRQVKTRRIRRPRLSAEAQELAEEFEALINESTALSNLVLYFKSRFDESDVAKLYELYLQSTFEILENASEVDMDVDLAFEQKVSHFTRMQERERMRQRFKELEDEELVMASNSVSDDDMLMNIEHHELMPKENKSDESNLWQIVLTIIALGVVAMLIRFVWVFLKS
jgi:endonuclease/exonuclease/phosphatase (EEP) superfamily protein YafD